eukprot:CFRG7853T1
MNDAEGCRLVAYIGKPILAADLVTLPTRSIIKQSYDCRERMTPHGYLNGDGFGVGWYAPEVAAEDPTPCVFHSVKPAWNNSNLFNLSNKIITPLLFAHIRAATPGLPVSESSCHPFHHGRYMFMHNGEIAGHSKIRRFIVNGFGDVAYSFAMEHPSDSGLAFAIFLDHLEDVDKILTPDELRLTIEQVIIVIREAQDKVESTGLSLLNFVVSDGYSIVATRISHEAGNNDSPAASLYIAAGTGFVAGETPGEYRIAHGGGAKNVAIVSSEPLTDDNADWLQIPRNYVVLITEEINVLMAPIVIKGLDTWICKEKRKLSSELSKCLGRLNNRKRFGSAESITQVVSQNVSSLIADATQRQLISRLERQDSSNVHAPPRGPHRYVDFSENSLGLAEFGRDLKTAIRHGGTSKTDKRSINSYSCSNSSVLAVIICPIRKRVYSGLDSSRIHVIDLSDRSIFKSYKAHRRAVLCLSLLDDILASGSSDRDVKLWNAGTLECLAKVSCGAAVIAMHIVNDNIWVGLQDTWVRSFSISDVYRSTPEKAVSPVGSPHESTKGLGAGWRDDQSSITNKVLQTEGSHCGFVLDMVVVGRWMCSAAGDGSIKTYDYSQVGGVGDGCNWHSPHRLAGPQLFGHRGSVMALAADQRSDELYSASIDMTVKCWDIESNTCKRTLVGHKFGILSLALSPTVLYSGDLGGQIRLWCRREWQPLKTLGVNSHAIQCLFWSGSLFSGGSDAMIREWGDHKHDGTCKLPSSDERRDIQSVIHTPTESLLTALSEFIAIRSISQGVLHREECWTAAKFLRARLQSIGAAVKLATVAEGQNPVVLARLGEDKLKPTVVVYGHYDVQPAKNESWKSDPWVATSIDGYIYGRGTTDAKGPILATIFAVKDLVDENSLPVNVVFIYEGEQERSHDARVGLFEVMAANKEMFEGGVDTILISNNYWLDDQRPCLTYGMRGNINLEVTIDGPSHDLHSGMDGGVVAEPLVDLTAVLASLVDARGMVLAPGFYDKVRDVSPAEFALYDDIDFDLESYRQSLGVEFSVNDHNSPTGILMSRWRNPALSITGIQTSSGEHVTNIAKRAVGQFSVRYVPDQTSGELVQLLTQHLSHEFRKRRSPNRLHVNTLHTADWWLGDPFSDIFRSAEKAIENVWKMKPIYVREGGTMSVTAVMEKYLNAPALHLPLGQSSDGAHLANERMSVNNIEKGREVIKVYLNEIGKALRPV